MALYMFSKNDNIPKQKFVFAKVFTVLFFYLRRSRYPFSDNIKMAKT